MYGTGHAGNAANAAPVTEVFGTPTAPSRPTADLQLYRPRPADLPLRTGMHRPAHRDRRQPPLTYRATGLPLGLAIDAAGGRHRRQTLADRHLPVTATATDSKGATATAPSRSPSTGSEDPAEGSAHAIHAVPGDHGAGLRKVPANSEGHPRKEVAFAVSPAVRAVSAVSGAAPAGTAASRGSTDR